MCNGVPPWWQTAIGSEEVAVTGLELDATTVSDGFPLNRGIEIRGKGLKHLATRHAKQKGVVRSGEVLSVTALETNDVVVFRYVFDDPTSTLGGPVSVLGD